MKFAARLAKQREYARRVVRTRTRPNLVELRVGLDDNVVATIRGDGIAFRPDSDAAIEISNRDVTG
jgi:hypothetical protein